MSKSFSWSFGFCCIEVLVLSVRNPLLSSLNGGLIIYPAPVCDCKWLVIRRTLGISISIVEISWHRLPTPSSIHRLSWSDIYWCPNSLSSKAHWHCRVPHPVVNIHSVPLIIVSYWLTSHSISSSAPQIVSPVWTSKSKTPIGSTRVEAYLLGCAIPSLIKLRCFFLS